MKNNYMTYYIPWLPFCLEEFGIRFGNEKCVYMKKLTANSNKTLGWGDLLTKVNALPAVIYIYIIL